MKKLGSQGHFHFLITAIIAIVGVAGFGAYHMVSASADVRAASKSVSSEKGCWLAGRKYKNDTCTKQCRLDAGKYIAKNGTGYCSGHVAFVANSDVCTAKLHRFYLTELQGCARRPSQTDASASGYCQDDYPFYNADFNNKEEGNKTLVDICEKSKRVATRNEAAGTPGSDKPVGGSSAPSGNGNGNSNNGGGQNQPSQPSTPKQQSYRVTLSYQNLGRAEKSAAAVFNQIKSSHNNKQNVVYGFSEIDEGDSGEHDALRAVFGKENWAGFTSREPVHYEMNDEWTNAGPEIVYLHAATGNNTGPARELVIAKLKRKDGPDTKLAVISTHFVTHAYNSKHDPRMQYFWNLAWGKLKDKVYQLNKDGYDVAITADFNRSGKLPSVHKDVVDIQKAGPDQLLAIPAPGRKVVDVKKGAIAVPSGESFHKNSWADLTFTNK